ncbi:MAG: serine protease [Planctomycetota bacterium]
MAPQTFACRILFAAWLSLHAATASAQTVCLPLPRLLTTTPMGGQIGSQCDVTITGENLDEGGQLVFSQPGLTATPKLDPAGKPLPHQYIVTIAADCPPGLYEARILTRLGISSSRIFSVGHHPEVLQTAGNTSLATAQTLPVNVVCNSRMSARSIDHYAFDAQAGQRYFVHCASRGIDSKLEAVLIVADAAGRDLLVERRGEVLDFKAPADGRCIIKVHELTYKGGPDYFYRLTLQQAPADAPLPVFASTHTVSSFSWPPAGLPATAPATETEPNNSPSQAQQITLPCDISAAFATAADVDVFQFDAQKGDVWWIEVASARLGRPTDPTAIVQQLSPAGAPEAVVDLVELTDIPSPMKPSSNGYAYDGPPYDGGSADFIGEVRIRETGRHQLLLSDLFGGTRTDPRNIYRLIIRRAAPDFALCAWGLHMELRNGDRNALSKPLALRGGSTIALEVVAVRRDGFDGPIQLAMEGLPEGVTAAGLTIPAGQNRGIVLLTADQNAPQGLAWARFTGTADIGGTPVQHACRIAAMAWPIVDSWGDIPSPRLVDGLPVSVSGSEFAPVSIAARDKAPLQVIAGQKLTLPLVLTRRTEFSGGILQLKTFGHGFQQHPQFDVSLTADTAETTLDTATLKTPPGDYQIAFYGSAVARYRYNPDAVTATEQALSQAREMLQQAEQQLQQATTAAAAATDETKAATTQQLEAAKALHTAATEALKTAEAAHKAAVERAQPRDTVDIVITEPISIRVMPAGAP